MDDQPPAQQNIEQPAASAPQAEGVKPSDPKPAQPPAADNLGKIEQEMTAFERSTLRWARTAVILSGLAAAFVCLQWIVMCQGGTDTHNLATAAGDQATWTQRLKGSADTQSEHMKELADHMKDQADRTKDLADQAKVQAAESTVAANAAKKAASIAEQALHISEKAYVVAGAMNLNSTAGLVTFPVINAGHIPSGSVSVIVHEATLNVSGPDAAPQQIIPVEAHWKQDRIESLPPTQGTITYTANVPVPAVIADQINKGFQQIVVAGTITYNDGFPGDIEQQWNFCNAITFDPKTKDIQFRPCDWNIYIPQLIVVDHYPGNQQKAN